jgi:hypothetical protein
MVHAADVVLGRVALTRFIPRSSMGRGLVAAEQPISKIFSDDYVFTIPGYQRPYSWTTEQAKALLDDLLGFIGTDESPMDKMFLG